jgi:ubiquinone/menaquinone biosynthesis C-methylase UbiE
MMPAVVPGATSGLPVRGVQAFWERDSCGEALYLRSQDRDGYLAQSRRRYELEPFIPAFANASATRGQRVLEIGVGLGADHQLFAEAGARLTGVDLTSRAIHHVRRRLSAMNLPSSLSVADAEHLPFADGMFYLAYSWGVLHHTPDTAAAIGELRRVLRPGGSARVMLYHRRSLVGAMLWLRYGLLAGRPWRTLKDVFADYMESPGTRAYSVAEARFLFHQFTHADVLPVLTHGDLLASDAGQRHRGALLSLARRLWPRTLLRALCPGRGLYLLITATR